MSDKNRRNNSLWLILLLLLGLIGVSIYAFKEKSNFNDLTTIHKELKQEFDNQVLEIEKLKTDNSGLQSKLGEDNKEIEQLKGQISRLVNKEHLSAKEVIVLTKKIGELNGEIDQYKNRIAELEQQVTTLQSEKQELTNKNQALSDTNNELKGKVNLASQIKAINFSSSFIKKAWFFGTKEKSTNNADKVKRVSISFFLQNNFLAEDGTKEIFLSIMQPNGEVLTDKELESGVQEFDYKGEKLQIKYTQKITVNYDKKLANLISTSFEPDVTPMLPGKYEVLVYDNLGNVISDRASFFFELIKDGK